MENVGKENGTRDSEGAGDAMTAFDFRRIRKKAGLSFNELGALLRYRDVRGLRRMEDGEQPISGPVQLVMEMLDDGRLNPADELAG